MVGLHDLRGLFQPKQVYKVKASAAWTGSGIAACYYFALFVYTKMTTHSLRVRNLLLFSSLSWLLANSNWFVFVTALSSDLPPSLDVRFSHYFICPSTGLDTYYTPLSFLRLNKFWSFCSNTSSSATLPAPQSHSWWELEMGSRQGLPTALVTIIIFIGHYWKYLPGCMQNQVVAFSQPC